MAHVRSCPRYRGTDNDGRSDQRQGEGHDRGTRRYRRGRNERQGPCIREGPDATRRTLPGEDHYETSETHILGSEGLMKSTLQVPPGKRLLPWLAATAAGALVWVGLLLLADAAGALSMYVGLI